MRQTQQEEDENLRHQLDNDFDSIRSLLFAGPPAPPASGEQQAEDQFPMPVPTSADPPPDDNDKEYDQYVRELALDRRDHSTHWSRRLSFDYVGIMIYIYYVKQCTQKVV